MNEETSKILEQLISTASDLFKEIEREVREYFTSEGSIDRLLTKLVSICIWIVAIIIEMSWPSPVAKLVSLSMTDWATSLWGINGKSA
jgi:hypothetical protein